MISFSEQFLSFCSARPRRVRFFFSVKGGSIKHTREEGEQSHGDERVFTFQKKKIERTLALACARHKKKDDDEGNAELELSQRFSEYHQQNDDEDHLFLLLLLLLLLIIIISVIVQNDDVCSTPKKTTERNDESAFFFSFQTTRP